MNSSNSSFDVDVVDYMKQILLAIVLVSIGVGCTTDSNCLEEEFTLVGKWGLIESCFDIGDGTKNCTDHNKESTYEFFADGTVQIDNESDRCISRYTLVESSMEFSSNDDGGCIDQSFFFTMIDACTITISPLCFEGCPQTYEKI